MVTCLAVLFAAQPYHPKGPKIEVDLAGGKSFVIETDPQKSPETTKGILKLVRSGFYNGQRVHRVEDWVIQWGDPQSKSLPPGDSRLGSVGSGHALPFEDSGVSFTRGVVGIASTGKAVGGDSQLFVLLRDAVYLNQGYAVLGRVVSGMSVVDHVKMGDKIVKMRVIGR